jgi:hypothetical protein
MEPSPHPTGLVELWRDRADQLDRFGDAGCARLWRIADVRGRRQG